MKKKIAAIAVLCSILFFSTGCSENDTPQSDSPSSGQDQVTVEEQVLLDQDGIKITLKELTFEEYDGYMEPSLKVLVENDTENNITVQTREESVNDIMAYGIISASVESGKKSNDSIVFYGEDLKEANIELIQNFELKFQIYNTETYDTLIETESIVITTSADPSYVQPMDDSGTVVLDEGGIKVVAKDFQDGNILGKDLQIYAENNTNQDISIQVRNASVNGFMLDPIFSCNIAAGKKAYDAITFYEDDLLENDIQNIEDVEFTLYIYNAVNYDKIFESEKVSLSF